MEAANNSAGFIDAIPDGIYPEWQPSDTAREAVMDGEYMLIDSYGGSGPLSYYGGKCWVTPEALQFMQEQMIRFSPILPDIDFLQWCWSTAFYYVDCVDPYVFFDGCCDVIKTEENYFYQYSFTDDLKEDWVEGNPGEVETFRYTNKGIQNWEYLLNSPGLKTYFDNFYDYFEDHYEWIMADEEHYGDEAEIIEKYGKDVAFDLMHLGLWSAIMWMCGPMARDWRKKHHPIFEIVYEYGECVMSGWCFYSKEHYRRDNRPAMTCAICGHSEWCVELVQVNSNETKYICEHCLNPVKEKHSTCGTRYCVKSTCPHHPGQRAARAALADNRYGEIKQLPNGRQVRDMPGMIYLNDKLMDQYSMSIADTVGKDLQQLLTF